MRIVRYFALLVGLGTVGFAVGDWASHPNFVGLVGLVLVIIVFSLLLGYLFRPDPAVRTTPVPPKEPEEPRKRKPERVWTEGWNAEEAQAARERRRR